MPGSDSNLRSALRRPAQWSRSGASSVPRSPAHPMYGIAWRYRCSGGAFRRLLSLAFRGVSRVCPKSAARAGRPVRRRCAEDHGSNHFWRFCPCGFGSSFRNTVTERLPGRSGVWVGLVKTELRTGHVNDGDRLNAIIEGFADGATGPTSGRRASGW